MKVKVSKTKLWKAIREHCLMCVGYNKTSVDECDADVKHGSGTPCPLWRFRHGYQRPPE